MRTLVGDGQRSATGVGGLRTPRSTPVTRSQYSAQRTRAWGVPGLQSQTQRYTRVLVSDGHGSCLSLDDRGTTRRQGGPVTRHRKGGLGFSSFGFKRTNPACSPSGPDPGLSGYRSKTRGVPAQSDQLSPNSTSGHEHERSVTYRLLGARPGLQPAPKALSSLTPLH